MITSKKWMMVLKIIHMISVISVVGGFLCILVLLLQNPSHTQAGTEAVYDRVMLLIFNTSVIYGAILLVITTAVYSLFTAWGFVKYRYLIIKWILLVCIFLVAWFLVGSALSGMTSISDAGYQADLMSEQYQAFEKKALTGIASELLLLIAAVVFSVFKPFGKRETKEFKHRKLVLIIFIPCVVAGIAMTIQGEIRHIHLRNTPIEDIDVSGIADGVYEGESTFGSYTYHVRVTVSGHRITDIEDVAPRDSVYVQYATGVFARIIEKQTPDVDAISGATTTSKAFMKAVENALKNNIRR